MLWITRVRVKNERSKFHAAKTVREKARNVTWKFESVLVFLSIGQILSATTTTKMYNANGDTDKMEVYTLETTYSSKIAKPMS